MRTFTCFCGAVKNVRSPSILGKILVATGTYEMLGDMYSKKAVYLLLFFNWLNKYKQEHDELEE
jgi:hypothetical protein